MSKWVDNKGIEIDFSIDFNTIDEVLSFYSSMYDENNLHNQPPLVGLPPHILNNQFYCLVLSAASEAACKRTKEELSEMKNIYDFDFYGKKFYDIYKPEIYKKQTIKEKIIQKIYKIKQKMKRKF